MFILDRLSSHLSASTLMALSGRKKKKNQISVFALSYNCQEGEGGTRFFFSLLHSLGFLSAH